MRLLPDNSLTITLTLLAAFTLRVAGVTVASLHSETGGYKSVEACKKTSPRALYSLRLDPVIPEISA